MFLFLTIRFAYFRRRRRRNEIVKSSEWKPEPTAKWRPHRHHRRKKWKGPKKKTTTCRPEWTISLFREAEGKRKCTCSYLYTFSTTTMTDQQKKNKRRVADGQGRLQWTLTGTLNWWVYRVLPCFFDASHVSLIMVEKGLQNVWTSFPQVGWVS